MKIVIRDFRGIADFEAATDGILLAAGDNGAGKSSICKAVAAAASGDMMPFKQVGRGNAALLVRDGAKVASAIYYQNDDNGCRVIWPDCDRQTKGTSWKDASRIAVGLENPATMEKATDRAAWLIELIGAKPTRERLLAALKKAAIPDPTAIKAADRVDAAGYDAAHDIIKEAATKAKGGWEKITGERYGSAKGPTWRPQGWRAALEGLAIADLEAADKEAAAALTELTNQVAGGKVNTQALQELVDGLPVHLVDQANIKRRLAENEAKRDMARADREVLGTMPKMDVSGMECPCCGAMLKVVNDKLVETSQDEDPEITKRLIASITAADNDLAAAERLVLGATAELAKAESKISDAEAAKIKLRDDPGKNAELEGKILAQHNITADTGAALYMKRQVIEASEKSEAVAHLTAICELLRETGLRKEVLAEKLEDFNAQLIEICKATFWLPVQVNEKMGFTYGERPYGLLSDGEAYRVRATLQLITAKLDGSPLVIFDGADILGKSGRNGLFAALAAWPTPAIVGMTILHRDDMPDLAAAGLGVSCWIDGGVVA